MKCFLFLFFFSRIFFQKEEGKNVGINNVYHTPCIFKHRKGPEMKKFRSEPHDLFGKRKCGAWKKFLQTTISRRFSVFHFSRVRPSISEGSEEFCWGYPFISNVIRPGFTDTGDLLSFSSLCFVGVNELLLSLQIARCF